MDYNDNDYEGQNLHLAGEESSKISSVLRPFALPKFDFDDSLHGHLRFDSLVENEVFLGIPSQEDNHWIEEFSRGGNGIDFSSSAAESCALPRHINVWSEATSSESVEMLLKSVGQEEMVPVENMVEESDPGEQLGSSSRQVEDNLGQDDGINDAAHGIPSSPPAELLGNSKQSAEIEGDHNDCVLQAQETSFSSSGAHVDSKDSVAATTENPNIDTLRTSDNQGETCGVMNESLSNQVQENAPVLGTEVHNTESLSQKISVNVRECVDQNKISDISFVISSCTEEGTSNTVGEHEIRHDKDDERLSRISVETDNTERHSGETPSKMDSSKEEHAVEIPITDFAEASGTPVMEESLLTDDRCNEVEFVVKPESGSHHAPVFSSGTEIKQQSEDCSMLSEKSSSHKGEDIEGLGTEDHDGVSPKIYGYTEPKKIPVGQPSGQTKSLVGEEDMLPGNNSSFVAPHANFESTILHDILGNPYDKGGESNVHHADDPGNMTASTFAGECHGEASATEDMRDAKDTSAQTETVEDGDHISPPLIIGSIQTGTGDITPIQVDAHEPDLDVSAHEKVDRKLPLDSSDAVCGENEKEVESTVLGEGAKVETTTGSQLNISAVDYPVSTTEVEDTKLTSSRVEGDDLVENHEQNPPSFDMEYRDHVNGTESRATKQPSAPISNESMEANELTPAISSEKETPLDSAAGETKTADQPVSLVEISSVSLPDGTGKPSNQTIEHSVNDLTVKDDGAEAARTEKPNEAETERNHEPNPSTTPVTGSTVEIDKSSQPATSASDVGCTNLPQSEMKKKSSPGKDNDEKIVKVPTTAEMSGATVPSKEEGTFTFDIRPLGGQSTVETATVLESFPRIQACKLSLTGEGSPSTSCSNQPTNPIVVKEISHVSSLAPDVNPPPSGGPSERKTRRGSSKSGKGSAKKGNQVHETTPLKQIEKGNKTSQVLSPLGTGQLVTFESGVKPRGAVSIPTSSLPDLNTSAPPSAFFQQPFSDLQQVQLRAQIFVYGSLIQGAVPDEACMISAFDGGRSFWEPSWRTCVERLHGQKSQGSNAETPVPSRSGAKTPDQSNRQGLPQSEVLSSMGGRASNKAIPSHVVNPMIPLSSPLWSISTPSGEALPPSTTSKSAVFDYQAVSLSPLNSYQSPPIRNYIAHTTWPSQAPFPVPWLASSQSSPFDISSNYPAFPITEPVKLTPVKDSSLPLTSGTKHVTTTPATHTGVTAVFAGPSSLDLKKVKASTAQTADTKSRKRKKSSGAAEDIVQGSLAASTPIVANQLLKVAPAVEDLSYIPLIGRNQADRMPTLGGGGHYSTSVAVATPSSFVSKGSPNQFFSVVPPSGSNDHLRRSDLSTDKRPLSIEGFSKVEEAKLQAQEAAGHAAAAISHCEGVWSQLHQQKNSGLTSDAESKLASAAVAIAAAASVAKAAAAAAKIASSAAVQAKQMADEAVAKSGIVSSTEQSKVGDHNSAPNLAISAAREAARKRIEAASAATKHAENLDAIVKAAELAAEAVSHAGKIVAMGDPFSLNELVEAGPNNYWKVSQGATVPGSKTNDMNKDRYVNSNAGEMCVYMNQHEGPDKDMHVTSHVASPSQREISRNDHVSVDENLTTSVKHGENSLRPQKDEKVSDSSNNSGIVSEPNNDSRSNSVTITSIKEGSNVEVLKDRGDSKKAWFSASVLKMKDDEALVCYKELDSEEGLEKLQEWISVEAKDGEAPKIRIPHPMTAVQLDETRKRRRAAAKDYTWSTGDKVDTFMQDCWREGIIAEKNKKDATSWSVHFPAQGETLMVKAWQLRPTLIWSDGQWIEWCRPAGEDGTSQGDTPVEKRQKLVSTSMEAKGKGKMAKNIDFAETGRQEEPRLPLAANEKVFSIGSTREEKKPNTARSVRSGLERERSGVVFGVPKPGKKRKFMEVSKHYVSDKGAKTNVPNDSVKLAKYLMPQGSGSRGLRNNNSKVDMKEKQVADFKPRALKSGKPPNIPSRTLAKKDETSSRLNSSDHVVKGSVSNEENESSEQNLAESGNVEETSEGTMVFTSQALPLEKRKKVATRNIKSERLNQGKLAPATGNSARNEGNEKSISDAAEPRRSNRRIQPTSRLLEGLQSSLIISKIPSSSHDKTHRSLNKGPTRGNNTRG